MTEKTTRKRPARPVARESETASETIAVIEAPAKLEASPAEPVTMEVSPAEPVTVEVSPALPVTVEVSPALPATEASPAKAESLPGASIFPGAFPGREGFEALIEAQTQLSDATAELRTKFLDFAEFSFASAAGTARKLAEAKTFADVFEINRGLAETVLDKFVETSGKIGTIGIEAAAAAAKPLSRRLVPSSLH